MDIPSQKAHAEKIVAQFQADSKGLEKLAQRCAFAEIRMGELQLELTGLKNLAAVAKSKATRAEKN